MDLIWLIANGKWYTTIIEKILEELQYGMEKHLSWIPYGHQRLDSGSEWGDDRVHSWHI